MAAEVVFCGALSHSPLMFVPEVRGASGSEVYLAATEEIRKKLQDLKVDTVLLFFPDHFRMVHYDHRPQLMIGLKKLDTWGDWYLPAFQLRIDEDLALHILKTAMANDFDLGYSVDMRMDHGGAQPLYVLGLEEVKVVPIFVNGAPPAPSLSRSYRFGRVVRQALEGFGQARRVAVLGSGGLSHQVPMPSWTAIDPEDRDIYDTFVLGTPESHSPEREEARIRRTVDMLKNHQVLIAEDFDREFLRILEEGRVEALERLTDDELLGKGGNGMSEVRCWAAAYGVAGGRGARIVTYVPVQEWVTGMGVAEFVL